MLYLCAGVLNALNYEWLWKSACDSHTHTRTLRGRVEGWARNGRSVCTPDAWLLEMDMEAEVNVNFVKIIEIVEWRRVRAKAQTSAQASISGSLHYRQTLICFKRVWVFSHAQTQTEWRACRAFLITYLFIFPLRQLTTQQRHAAAAVANAVVIISCFPQCMSWLLSPLRVAAHTCCVRWGHSASQRLRSPPATAVWPVKPHQFTMPHGSNCCQ